MIIVKNGIIIGESVTPEALKIMIENRKKISERDDDNGAS